MKTAFGLLIGLALIAGCDKPAGGSKGSPVIESWNPPKDSTNVVLLYSSSADRTGYKFEVPKAMVERLPDWDPNSNTIPLLPQQDRKSVV